MQKKFNLLRSHQFKSTRLQPFKLNHRARMADESSPELTVENVGPAMNPAGILWGRRAWELLSLVRARSPLVQCITNFVSMDLVANSLLAAGASPAMVHSIHEIDAFTPRCDAIYVNIGTLSESWLPSMRAAASAAVNASRPWILDPVAVSASDFRMDACLGLVALRPAVIRGNPSEILALSSACRFSDSKVTNPLFFSQSFWKCSSITFKFQNFHPYQYLD